MDAVDLPWMTPLSIESNHTRYLTPHHWDILRELEVNVDLAIITDALDVVVSAIRDPDICHDAVLLIQFKEPLL